MTSDRQQWLADTFLRLFRARTPATDLDHILPESRVTFTELDAAYYAAFGVYLTPLDRVDMEPALAYARRHLRREFPEERWTSRV